MLSSSVVSTISAVELTAITNSLASTTFRSFEFYFVATGLYLAMALGFRGGSEITARIVPRRAYTVSDRLSGIRDTQSADYRHTRGRGINRFRNPPHRCG